MYLTNERVIPTICQGRITIQETIIMSKYNLAYVMIVDGLLNKLICSNNRLNATKNGRLLIQKALANE